MWVHHGKAGGPATDPGVDESGSSPAQPQTEVGRGAPGPGGDRVRVACPSAQPPWVSWTPHVQGAPHTAMPQRGRAQGDERRRRLVTCHSTHRTTRNPSRTPAPWLRPSAAAGSGEIGETLPPAAGPVRTPTRRAPGSRVALHAEPSAWSSRRQGAEATPPPTPRMRGASSAPHVAGSAGVSRPHAQRTLTRGPLASLSAQRELRGTRGVLGSMASLSLGKSPSALG